MLDDGYGRSRSDTGSHSDACPGTQARYRGSGGSPGPGSNGCGPGEDGYRGVADTDAYTDRSVDTVAGESGCNCRRGGACADTDPDHSVDTVAGEDSRNRRRSGCAHDPCGQAGACAFNQRGSEHGCGQYWPA